tara:strand:- start:5765 stop:7531 length:1767 start_codon:yes stop_codon:yes gene_type:complete
MKNNKDFVDILNNSSVDKKKIYNEIKKNTKPIDIPGKLVKSIDTARTHYNESKMYLTPQQKAIILHKLKNTSPKKMKKEAIKNIDIIIKDANLEKAREYKALKKKISFMKLKNVSHQKRGMASKLFVSITHEEKNKKGKNKTKKSIKKGKKRKSKTLKKMKGGSVAAVAADPQWYVYVFDWIYYTIGDFLLFPAWLIASILGILLYSLVEIFQYTIGSVVTTTTTDGVTTTTGLIDWDSLYKFLQLDNGFYNIVAPANFFTSIGSWPGELLTDGEMIAQNIPGIMTDLVQNDIVKSAELLGTGIEYGAIPFVEGVGETALNITGDVVGEVGNAAAVVGSTVGSAAVSLYPSISSVFGLCLKVVLGEAFLAALLTSIPFYLYYERENLKNAYDNVSKYGWIISLFPMDIDADSNFYCEEKIDLDKEIKKVDILFDVEKILKYPKNLMKIIEELKINGRQLNEFQELVESDLKTIDVNIFTRQDMFEEDFKKFRKQINISKNIEFTRKIISFRKKIIEKTTELIVSIETMKQNGTFQNNEPLIRVLIDKIKNSVKETINNGYSYCKEKSGQQESESENKTKKNKTKKNKA